MNLCILSARLALCALLGGFITVPAHAQPRKVTGKVTAEGAPLPGVSIKLHGKSQEAVTDDQGVYAISAAANDILIFTALGYEKKELAVGQGDRIDVELIPKVGELGEVVVVGYGVQKKSDVTNSVSTVDFEDLQNVPQANTMNMLAGRVAGLNVVQASGEPGDNNNEVTIRGVGTVNDASPLVIIDGIAATMQDFSVLSPNEIASVSVLKDATSTAIYGARGANGVILVTTKAPKEGRFKVAVNSYYGIQDATEKPKFVNTWQWMILHNEAANRELYPQWAIDNVRNGIYTDTFANYNPVDDVFRLAPQHAHNLNLSGGSKAISFQGSVGYLDQEGILIGSNSDRFNYRSNAVAEISAAVKMGLNISGNTLKSHGSFGGINGLMTNLFRNYPITPRNYANGDWGVYNLHDGRTLIPAPLYAQIGRTDAKERRSNIIYFLEYKPIRGLNLKTQVGYTSRNQMTERFNPTYSYNAPDGTPAAMNNINTLINNGAEDNQLQTTTTANFSQAMRGGHRITLLAGHEYIDFNRSTMQARGSNLPTNDHQVLSRATTDISINGTKEGWRMQSFFGRVNYALKDRYFLEGNLRMDGSSRFPENKQYILLPSLSGGWMISNEQFFKRMNLENIIDQFKVRAGWGKSGNDRMAPGTGQLGNYVHQQTLNLENYYYFGGNLYPGAAITAFANKDISWESTESKGLGVDLTLLKNSLDITVDIYDRMTDGILFRVPLPPSFGGATPAIQNVAMVANRGWEITVSYQKSWSDFFFQIGGNLSYNKNNVVSLRGEEVLSSPFILREGEEFNSFYGLVFDGIIKDSTELATVPAPNRNALEIGSMKFKDINGDGKIDDKDRMVLGSSNIPYAFGINGAFTYKGLSIAFLLQGVKGKTIFVRDWGNRPGDGAIMNFWREWWDNRYDAVNNPEGTWPVLNRSAPGSGETSTFWLHDASYLRLKNIELGYTLPTKWLSSTGITDVRIFAAGQNLLTFTPLIKQIDPERRADVSRNVSYPQLKVMTFGFNVSF
ncbi:SusC/RagA family TonB-linked outer membrane protein [Parapedobacter deserti]|uniref:SusC/RagA family TonB-linked outer membrane protein n=1 Tax=Parapedobacter deserti TaxID=1912957 RepID=A0ABV7JSE8_9SPHI